MSIVDLQLFLLADTNQQVTVLFHSTSANIPGWASVSNTSGFLVPTRNGELLRWCLQHRLRLVHQMTLMTIGLYNEPTGAYLPSVLY